MEDPEAGIEELSKSDQKCLKVISVLGHLCDLCQDLSRWMRCHLISHIMMTFIFVGLILSADFFLSVETLGHTKAGMLISFIELIMMGLLVLLIFSYDEMRIWVWRQRAPGHLDRHFALTTEEMEENSSRHRGLFCLYLIAILVGIGIFVSLLDWMRVLFLSELPRIYFWFITLGLLPLISLFALSMCGIVLMALWGNPPITNSSAPTCPFSSSRSS